MYYTLPKRQDAKLFCFSDCFSLKENYDSSRQRKIYNEMIQRLESKNKFNKEGGDRFRASSAEATGIFISI